MKDKIISESKKIVYRLRQRPEEERRHILHILMVAVCIIMVTLWAWSLRLGGAEPKEASVKKERAGLEPFSALKENLVNGFESIQADTSNLTE